MMAGTMIKIKKLTEDAKIPTLSNPTDAGLDLCTTVNVEILPGCRATLETGLAFALPVGTVGLVWPRSKLASKWGLDVLAGVVDCDYRGEVMVNVINHGHKVIELRIGDKIAQMIVQEHKSGLPITEVDLLDDTVRGSRGINDNELRLN